eukprot:SAG31_NODE_5411_length_2554_cov_1.690865_2_plen_59_part_00
MLAWEKQKAEKLAKKRWAEKQKEQELNFTPNILVRFRPASQRPLICLLSSVYSVTHRF